MRSILRIGAAAALLAIAVLPVRAAESYDNCKGFIDAVPATISTQGTWCLRKDLSTAMASGAAITVATNNVTIDCNDFKVGGLAAGDGTNTSGIKGTAVQNVTVRNCNVRGFLVGVLLLSSWGSVVEHNRLDGNTYAGIEIQGNYTIVRDNVVTDTGGRPGAGSAYGILVAHGHNVTVQRNVVTDVFPGEGAGGERSPTGIALGGGIAEDNYIGQLTATTPGQAIGIRLVGTYGRTAARNNSIVHPTSSALGTGIAGSAVTTSTCLANIVQGYATGIADCQISGNLVQP
ncbi:MAG TPA: right-handed parallel beta-helix repeat-containing protein [Lysobacter sp.]